MATGKVTRWCRNGKTFAAEEGDVPFSLSDADDVWGVEDPKDLYNPAIPTIEKVLEDDERRLEAFYKTEIENEERLEALDEAIDKYGNNWQDYISQEGIRQRQYSSLREGAMSTFMTAANNARMRRNNDSLQDNGDTHFGDNNDNDCTSLASMTSHRIPRRKKRDRQKMRKNKDDLHNSGDTHFGDNNDNDCTSLASMTSHSSLAGYNSPSNDIGKSIDAEGVSQGLSYPDSTGAAVTPPEVDSLVGGKRKSGKSRKRKKSKRAKSNNHNVIGGCRVVITPLTNELEKRDCMKRALHSLLNPKEKKIVLSEAFPSPSDGGDVSISISNTWLMKYDMTLEPVTARYNKQGGLLYNLLQDLESRLVIKVVLTMCDGGIADHFIAYDGTTLHDVPHSIKPLRDDRKIPSKCLAIFKKLYPTKNYSAFQVTNVFELRTNLKIIKECDLLGP